MGLVECMKHSLVEPYPVLYEKDGEYIARVVYTVIVRKKSMLIT
jgi:methionine aminopeptidase